LTPEPDLTGGKKKVFYRHAKSIIYSDFVIVETSLAMKNLFLLFTTIIRLKSLTIQQRLLLKLVTWLLLHVN
jgi:hypothetical protein